LDNKNYVTVRKMGENLNAEPRQQLSHTQSYFGSCLSSARNRDIFEIKDQSHTNLLRDATTDKRERTMYIY